MAPSSPVVARWDLGLRLRERRELLGLAGTKASKLIGLSPTFLSDVESGKKNVPEAKLGQIADAYEFNEDEAAELEELREVARHRGWWSKFSGLFAPEVLRFFGLEHGAETILTFNSSLIHGLLQTREYAQAIIESGSPNARLAEAGRRVEARLTRQRRLDGDDPLKLITVLSEAALRQQIGGPEVLRRQLLHLVQRIEDHPALLTVLIVPFAAPGHDALDGSFHVLSFSKPNLPSIAWVEMVTSMQLIEDPVQVKEYDIAHASATDVALNPVDSLELIKQTAKDLE
ncbi:DUF5753 domain-containing protein [Amycolatopsis cihanbeyliensis]|uniref:Helix-turn-helix protein n=1 Tax=Amycolatopsis cihanbeyliensis TaxID=1128664 RepID=A0A542DS23_AMYCI|nr:DUF5753 domain-containing protein [Amycolatopsis cihanbeyliensis]TQJ05784.1 helix-turn-helix protein [Amycolatopsis cihanbeyliensis]